MLATAVISRMKLKLSLSYSVALIASRRSQAGEQKERGRQSFLMSKRTKTYRPRRKVRHSVANPFMAPPKAEVRREIEALTSGVPVTRCPTGKKTPKPQRARRS